MSFRNHKFSSLLLVPLIIGGLLFSAASCHRPEQAASSFGKYARINDTLYTEWGRTSRYLEMSDGVKLACDIIRPAEDGRPVEKPLPCIWTHARYHRARLEDGRVRSMVDRSDHLKVMLRHGYVVAAVNVRGGGASFGRYEGVFSPRETRDAYEITEWLAAQPWCDGNIGMYGASYLGITQFKAASLAPPHLKAIFPSMAAFDLFTLMRGGGIYREGFLNLWGDLTHKLDNEIPPVPVDDDPEGILAAQAVARHHDNWDVLEQSAKAVFRDGKVWTEEFEPANPSAFIDEVNASGVAVYIWAGIYDIWARDAFQWFANLTGPKKLTIGTWPHNVWTEAANQEHARLLTGELLRWYDYWLKGIDNGIMDEAPLHYGVLEGPDDWSWHAADTWPLPRAEAAPFYFGEGPVGSIASANDGFLSRKAPKTGGAYDAAAVDFTATSGTQTRWANAAGVPMEYPDMAAMDKKGLTYTTEPLAADMTVTGHPLVRLFVTSDQPDGDFYVFLEEVDTEGVSHYVTEGRLRASRRALGEAPYDNLGLPYFPISKDNQLMLTPGEPVELFFDLHPVSNLFDAGHRIRVTVTGADAGNSEIYLKDRRPTVKVFRGPGAASRILLPVIPD